MVKVYVANLPFKATEDDVSEHFSQYGKVEKVILPVDRDTKKPRGFGFVSFSEGDGDSIIQRADGSELMGRQLKVKPALEKADNRK